MHTDLLATGRTAEIYAYGSDKVLKLYYSSCPLDRADLEARVTRLLFQRGLPVPQVFETVEVNDRSVSSLSTSMGSRCLQRALTITNLLVRTAKRWRIYRGNYTSIRQNSYLNCIPVCTLRSAL